MAGRTKQPVYIYNYKGAFLEKLESKTEYVQKYFNKSRNSAGNVYFNKYGVTLIDEQFVATNERIGRDKIKQLIKISTSAYCNLNNKDTRTIKAYNLLGKEIASFKGIAVASKMTNIPHLTIFYQLNNSKNKQVRSEITFKYK